MKRFSRGMQLAVSAALALAFVVSIGSVAVQAQKEMKMKKPKMVTLEGTVIDLTCAAKGQAMMGSWHNAENEDHMTPDGVKKQCATMCLKGGQPAALFDADKGKILTVFACNPRATLAEYAAEDVEVMGFWAGSSKDDAKSFVPQKIRKKGASKWEDCDCATMH